MKMIKNESIEVINNNIDLLTQLKPHFGRDLLPFLFCHPLVRGPLFLPLAASGLRGRKTSEDSESPKSKMAKIDGECALMVEEGIRQYQDMIQNVRSSQSSQMFHAVQPSEDIEQTSDDAETSSRELVNDPTELTPHRSNFQNVRRSEKVDSWTDGLASGAQESRFRDGSFVEESYNGQDLQRENRDGGYRRFGNEYFQNFNRQATETLDGVPNSAPVNFYSSPVNVFSYRSNSTSVFPSPAPQGASPVSLIPIKTEPLEEAKNSPRHLLPGGAPGGSDFTPRTKKFLTSQGLGVTVDEDSDNFSNSIKERRDERIKILADQIGNMSSLHEIDGDGENLRGDQIENGQELEDDPNKRGWNEGSGGCSPNEVNNYTCPSCTFTTTDSMEFLPHIINHCRQPRLGGPPYNPEDRRRKFDGMFANQPSGNSRKKGFHCKKCDFESEDKDVYYEHLASHIKIESRYSCILCSFVTGLRHHITYHICNHFGIKSISCSIDKCTYVCINQSMLKSHLKKHPDLVCSDCDFTTKSNSEMDEHVRESGHSAGTNIKRPDEMRPRRSESFGSQETPSRFYGMPPGAVGLGPQSSSPYGVGLSPYLNPAMLAGNTFPHGLVPPLMWPGALNDGQNAMSQSPVHPYYHLKPEVSPSFSQSVMSPERLAGQFANASDLYHQFMAFQKNFPSATVPPVTGYPLATHNLQASVPKSKTHPAQFFSSPNEQGLTTSKEKRVPKMLPETQKIFQEVPQKNENAAPLDLRNSQPSSKKLPDVGGDCSDADLSMREHSNRAGASSEPTAIVSSKYSRRKGVARKVVVDPGLDEYARFASHGFLNCENLASHRSYDDQSLGNGRPSSEGCLPSAAFDSRHVRNSNDVGISPKSESENAANNSALFDLIDATENLLPYNSNASQPRLDHHEQSKETPSSKGRNPESNDSSAKSESTESIKRKPTKMYDCNHCGIRFQDYVLYSMHSGYHNFNNPLQCNFCGRKYDNFYDFYEHIGKVEHPES